MYIVEFCKSMRMEGNCFNVQEIAASFLEVEIKAKFQKSHGCTIAELVLLSHIELKTLLIVKAHQ